MASLGWSVLLLAATVQIVRAEYDPDICYFFKESYGLIPPPIPRNFESKGDFVDFNTKKFHYSEMYFDYTNNRGKYMFQESGIEHHFLFDYDVRQVVEWQIYHPGLNIRSDPLSQDCETSDLDDSESKAVFGFMDEFSSWPKMYDANQVLRFGGQYQYAFNGTYRMEERGLLVDKFVGCVYDSSIDATMAMNYSFTNSAVYTSGGSTTEDVLGVFDSILSVPAKMDAVGSVYDENTQQRQFFNRSRSNFWFKGEPEFEIDTFRIPPYMYCEDFQGLKYMPEFPSAFSTRLQRTKIGKDTLGALAKEVTSFEKIYYYKDRNLARRDHTPDPDYDTDIYAKFLNYNPVRSIYDFNTGILFVTNIPTGRCYYRPIIHGDYFDMSKQKMFVKMADPDEVFRMQHDDMEYKGSHFARDIECDVWVGKYHDEVYNKTYIKETYISTNGWHEESDELLEYGVPIKHTIINRDLTDDLVEDVNTYHFLKFKNSNPPLASFDISNCLETINHRDFAILLDISNADKNVIFKYKFEVLENAQYFITEITDVFTPLRVQRLELRQVSPSDVRTFLAFSLVDKPKLKTQTPVGQPGASFNDAIIKLQTFIDQNQFSFRFLPPGSKDSVRVRALRGSLYVRKADGDLQAFPHTEPEDPIPEVDATAPTFQHADGDEKETKGMSPGGLALLAVAMFFIGIGIGISIMYLYLRRGSGGHVEDRITLTPQASTSTDFDPLPETS